MMKNNKIITFIACLIVSVGLWFFVVKVVNPDSEVTISDIPVVFSGDEVLRKDQQLTIADGRDATVSVRFTGKNSELKKLSKARDEITAVVDVTNIRSAKDYNLHYDINLPSAVQASAVTADDLRPSSVQFSVQRLISKPVEIRSDLTGVQIAEGYMLDSTTFDYDAVTVEGPESIVSTIAAAEISLAREDIDKSFTEMVPYKLVDADGKEVSPENLTTNIDAVEVSVNIVMYKEIPLEVEFINRPGAAADDVSYEIEPRTITLSADPTILEAINKITVGNIDLANTPNTAEKTFPIVIPDDAKNVSGEEEAKVTIKVKNKATSVLRATNIAFINLASGLDAQSMTQLVQTTVRADTDEIGSITANNLRVVADMSQVTQTGKQTVPVEIYIDGFPEAGVIGEYTIVVSVTTAQS